MAQSLNAPRKPKAGKATTPGMGHNQLTPEQVEALYLSHLAACREQDAAVAKAMEAVKALRKVRSQVRNTAKADGFPLSVIDEVLAAEARSRGDLQLEQDLRRNMWSWAGLPVGGQGDLFKSMPLEVRDAADWEAEGYAAGVRGAEGVPPTTVPPRFISDWSKGWGNGQARLAWGLAERKTIKAQAAEISPQIIRADNDNADLLADEVA